MVKKQLSRQRFWTDSEIRHLRALAKRKLSAATIAHQLKRSVNSTKKKASILGLSLGAAPRWTNNDLRKLKVLAKKKEALAKIAKELKRTMAAVEKMASNHGISLDMRQ